MIDTGFIYPVLFGINSNSVTEEGAKSLQTDEDVNYTVTLLREGESLNALETDLSIRLVSGESGGSQLIRQRPDQFGYMPRNFSEPLKIQIAYEQSTDPDDYLGQSAINVREFKKFEVDQFAYPFRNTENARLFSFGGDLYFLTDHYVVGDGGSYIYVTLYKYDVENEIFHFHHRFDKVCDFTQIAGESQYGSPDFCEVDGVPHVCFRVVDVVTEETFIYLYSGDEDLLEWDVKTIIPIENTYPVMTSYRLRMAYGNSTLMIVHYGIREYQREATNFVVEANDLRTFHSFDNGATFQHKIFNPSNIKIDSVNGSLRSVRSSSSLYQLFTPSFTEGRFEYELQDYGVNFALYYDEDMASFVIMKPGSPTLDQNRLYLMGVKTVDGDYSNWEPCLKHRLLQNINGLVPLDDNDNFDPYAENAPNVTDNSYFIKDLDIVATPTEKIAVMELELYNSTDSLDESYGVALTEFRFVHNNDIPPGYYDRLFAYGGKYHSEWNFVGTNINKEWNGLLSVGGPVEDSRPFGHSPLICSYRNGYVSTCKMDRRNESGFDGYRFLVFHKPWSNVGEQYGYEFAYTAFDVSVTDWPLSTQTASGGTIAHNDTDHYLEFDLANSSSTAYLEYSYSVGNYPSLLEKAEDFTDDRYWKSRFEINFDLAPASSMEFFKCNVGGNGITLILESDRTITAQDPDGGSLGTIIDSSISLSTDYEFLVGFFRYRDKTTRFFVWYRERGDLLWTRGDTGLGTMSGISNTTNEFKVGCVSTDQGGQLVRLRSVQISSYEGGVRPTFGEGKIVSRDQYDGPNLYTFPSNTDDDKFYCGAVDVYNNQVELQDGSKLRLDIGTVQPDLGTPWSYEETPSYNSVRNIINGVADSIFDFTNAVTSSEFTVYLDNTESVAVDAISLIGLFGCYRFKLQSGDYDFDLQTWSNDDENYYSLPYQTLTINSYSGNFIELEDEFSAGQIVDYNILLYDTTTGEYTGQFFIVQNFGSVIEIDDNVPDLTDIEVRLFLNSFTFDVDIDTVGERTKDVLAITFYTPNEYTLCQLGEVVLGRLVDTSELITEVAEEATVNNTTSDSDRGYKYLLSHSRKNITEERNIVISGLSVLDNTNDISSILESMWRNNLSFPIVYDSESGSRTEYGCIGDKLDMSMEGFSLSYNFNFFKNNYYPRSNTRVTNLAPTLTISANKREVSTGENISFTAVSVDPEGETPTYLWDFGDETTSTSQNPVKSFSDDGVYTVSCTSSDGQGGSTTKTLKVSISNSSVQSYDRVDDSGGTYVINQDYTFTFTAQDVDGNDADYENKLSVTLLTAEDDVEIEGTSQVGGTNETFRLVEGVAEFEFRSASTGDKDFVVFDTIGNYEIFTITFIP